MTIYVGNLNYETNETDLNTIFSQFGEIKSIKIIKDNYSGQSKGFAFVDMMEEQDGNNAINALHETELSERTITVSKAKPRTNSSSFSSSSYNNDRRNNNGRNNYNSRGNNNSNKRYNY